MRHLRRIAATAALLALTIALSCGALAQPAFAATPDAPIQVFDRSTIHFTRLDNGLRVVVREDHSAPLVAVNVVVRVGTVRETDQNNGISHFLEHMVFRAARTGTQDLLGGPIEVVGGVVNGGALRDFTTYHAVTPAQYLALALGTLARAITRPSFDEQGVFNERLVVMRETQQLADQPEVAVWDLAFALAYPGQPYRLPIGGTESSLVKISPSILAAFHRAWYVPDNASVIIVGDVSPEAAVSAVTRAFGNWKGSPSGRRPPSPSAPPARSRVAEQIQTRAIKQAVVFMGFPAPGISDPRDVCAMDLLLSVLCQGFRSRLTEALLNTRLADQVNGDFLTQALPGLLGIQANCAPERIPQVRQAIANEVLRLSNEPLGEEEMARARRVLTHDYVFGGETFEDQAATLGFYEAIATYEFAVTYLDQVRALTAADLQSAARKYLNPAHAVWAQISPAPRTTVPETVRAPGDNR